MSRIIGLKPIEEIIVVSRWRRRSVCRVFLEAGSAGVPQSLRRVFADARRERLLNYRNLGQLILIPQVVMESHFLGASL